MFLLFACVQAVLNKNCQNWEQLASIFLGTLTISCFWWKSGLCVFVV